MAWANAANLWNKRVVQNQVNAHVWQSTHGYKKQMVFIQYARTILMTKSASHAMYVDPSLSVKT